MLTVNIICIGKLKETWLKQAELEYTKRLSAYCRINVKELAEYRLPDNPSNAQIEQGMEAEGKEILKQLKGVVIPMCIEGAQMPSTELADNIKKIAVNGESEISFVIGGSFGICDDIKQKGRIKLSMSKMTFPHQLARIMLLEQIYRAFSINANAKYHK